MIRTALLNLSRVSVPFRRNQILKIQYHDSFIIRNNLVTL